MKDGKQIKMTFICDQDWDSMSPTAKGRYCDVCKREVLDYTDKSVKNIKREDDLCGRFNIDQVDPCIIRPIQVPRQLKSFGFISAFLLSIFSKASFAQVSQGNKTEQVASATPVAKDSTAISCETDEEEELDTAPDTTRAPFLITNKRRYYWSNRFPFIVSKRNRLMGRFRASSFR